MQNSAKAANSLLAALVLAACLVCSTVSLGWGKSGGGSPASQNIPVVSYLANNPAGSSAYDIQGDGLGSTSTALNASVSEYRNNVDSVTSILNANTYNHMPVGDWQLTTMSSTVRTVRIDLTNQGANGEVAPAVLLGGSLPARLIEDCTKISLDITQMTAGQTIQCPAWFRFNTSNSNLYYGLNLNPVSDPATGSVSIYCISTGGNGFCHYWTVDPPAGGPVVAQLQQLNTSRGQTTSTPLGYSKLTFHFEVDETQANP